MQYVFFHLFYITIDTATSDCSLAAVISTLDGDSGFDLAFWVLLVIYSSNLQSTSKLYGSSMATQTATFGAQGRYLSIQDIRGAQGKSVMINGCKTLFLKYKFVAYSNNYWFAKVGGKAWDSKE